MHLRSGADSELEQAAEEILAADRRATRETPGGAQYLVHNILSPDQWILRQQREVITTRGNFDVEAQPGIYGRVWVDRPSRPTRAKQFSLAQDPWRQAAFEFYGDEVLGAWLPRADRDEVVGGQHYGLGLCTDPLWAHHQPTARSYHHLDRFQRSRIRAKMAKAAVLPPGMRLLVSHVLAAHYGVPPWVITLVCRKTTPQE